MRGPPVKSHGARAVVQRCLSSSAKRAKPCGSLAMASVCRGVAQGEDFADEVPRRCSRSTLPALQDSTARSRALDHWRRHPDVRGVVLQVSGPPAVPVEIAPMDWERRKLCLTPGVLPPESVLPVNCPGVFAAGVEAEAFGSGPVHDGSSLVRSSLTAESTPTCNVCVLLQSVVLWHCDILEHLGPEETVVLEEH